MSVRCIFNDHNAISIFPFLNSPFSNCSCYHKEQKKQVYINIMYNFIF